jgi:O-antigen ligase
MTGLVGVTSIMSLSSGPLVALVVQGFLLCWNGLLGTISFRWKLLIALVALVSVAIELVANRSVLDIVVSYFLFDPISYWGRQMIWDYATASALNHPFFGVGLNEWERPTWLGSGSSIDNFWLLLAVKYGLPAAFLMPLAFFSIFLALASKKGLDARLAAYRTGFLITMTAFFTVAWTVHFWDAAYVVFLFLMGSGVWMLDVKPRSRPALEAQRV